MKKRRRKNYFITQLFFKQKIKEEKKLKYIFLQNILFSINRTHKQTNTHIINNKNK